MVLSTWFGFTDAALLFILYLSLFSLFFRPKHESIIPIMPSHLWCSARFSLGPILLILYKSTGTLLHSSRPPQSTIIVHMTLMTLFLSYSINHLLHVVKQISSWMTSNLLCLNPSKPEIILIGLRDQLKKIRDPSISLSLDSVSTHAFTPTSPVRKLGVIFDPNLSFSDHITQLSRSCFMHIRDLRRIRPMLDLKTASTIATSIVHAKLDYTAILSS